MSASSDGEWVSVDLLDDPAPQASHGDVTGGSDGGRSSGGPSAGFSQPARSRLVKVAAIVVAVLVGLVVWPDASTTSDGQAADPLASQTVPPPQNPRLLAWPGRGPWAGDTALVEEAAAVWRTNAQTLGVDPPGDEVHPLWAGPVNDRAVVVLQSVGPDSVVRIAQLTESRMPPSVVPGALSVIGVSAVPFEPPFVALTYPGGLGLGGVLDRPGAVLIQVLPAPDLVDEDIEWQRVADPEFQPVPLRPDGLSQPWVHAPWLVPSGPVVAAVRTAWPSPGVLATGLITPERLAPSPSPVQVVAPSWGRTREHSPEDYLDGLAALRSLDRSSGRVSVLGSTLVGDTRAALVEVRPTGPGSPVVVTVGSRGTTRFASEPRPAGLPTEMAIGAVRSIDGSTLVVAAGPPDTDLIVLGADGAPIATGPRTTAAWVDRDVELSEVAAQGYRRDASLVGRTALDVSDL